MGYKKDFSVNITRLTTAVAQKGFGTILILSSEQAQPVKAYTSVLDVVAEFDVTTKTYKLASALFSQGVDEVLIAGAVTTVGTALVTELNKVTLVNDSFFGVVSTENSDATITAISTWVDTQQKVYAVTSKSKTIKNASDQTMIAYHPDEYIAEKSLAYMLTKEIGAVDLDGKKISGVTTSGVTATEYSVFKTNNINVATEKFGNVVIDGGNMAGGEKVDVILGEFWIKLRMEEDLAERKMNTPKIPYTDAGVALLVDAANTRLKLATLQGIIATDADGVPEYEVTYLPVAEVAKNDRANRVYNHVKWTARIAGAIRGGPIWGELSV